MDASRKTPDLSELLRHAAWLRRLVAPLLAGNEAIEDVLQETWTAALERPPREGTRWRSWLARVAWNRAQRARRETHRRTRREALAAKAETVHAADRLVAELEVQTKLATAVLALEPNQRRAILLRFYEGLPPRVIAEQLGAPVATVKTWIHRGIEKLRSSLASELGVDWRNALAPLAVPVAFAVPAASSTLGLSSVLLGVAMQAKLAVGLFVLSGIGVASWFLWRNDASESVPEAAPSTSANATKLAATSPIRASNPEPLVDRNAPLSPSDASTTPPPPLTETEPKLARISGRCVDAKREPLGGVRIKFDGQLVSEEKRLALERSGHVIAWTDPPLFDTEADGRFEVAFDPPPTHRYYIRFTRADLVQCEARWDEVAPGQHVDLGDLVMSAGCRVAGIVRDAEGNPRAKLSVSLQQKIDRSQAQPRVFARRNLLTHSEADGRFAFQDLAAPGSWSFQFVEEPQARAHVLEITADQRDAYREIQLDPRFAGETISGTIVDECDRPISGASVSFGFHDMKGPSLHGRWSIVQERPDAQGPRPLVAECAGYEPITTATKHAWGESGIKLVLARALDLEIVVLDRDSGAPIEEFAMLLCRRQANGLEHSGMPVPYRKRHEDGIARLPGAPRGSYRVQVDPTDAAWARSAFQDFEHSTGGTRVEVRLERSALLRVRVEDPAGASRVDSKVTLLELLNTERLGPRTTLASFSADIRIYQPTAIQIGEAVTDAHGEVALPGPLGRPLYVLVRSADHVEIKQPGVVFEKDRPLVITAGSGGRVRGRIGPPELLSRMRQCGDVPLRDADWSKRESFAPTVHVRRGTEKDLDIHPAAYPQIPGREGVHVLEDGNFELDGIPPGTWELHLRFHKLHRHPGAHLGGRSSTPGLALLGTIADLREGETRELRFDRPDLVLSELKGRALENGVPIAHGSLLFVGRPRQSNDYAATDGEGRFSILLEAGTYQVRSRFHDQVLDETFECAAIGEVALRPAATLETEIRIESGEIALRAVDAHATTASGVRLEVCCDSLQQRIGLPITSAEGRTRGRLPAGTWRVEVVSLPDASAKMEVGSIRIAAGQTAEIEQELRLPASWTGR